MIQSAAIMRAANVRKTLVNDIIADLEGELKLSLSRTDKEKEHRAEIGEKLDRLRK